MELFHSLFGEVSEVLSEVIESAVVFFIIFAVFRMPSFKIKCVLLLLVGLGLFVNNQLELFNNPLPGVLGGLLFELILFICKTLLSPVRNILEAIRDNLLELLGFLFTHPLLGLVRFFVSFFIHIPQISGVLLIICSIFLMIYSGTATFFPIIILGVLLCVFHWWMMLVTSVILVIVSLPFILAGLQFILSPKIDNINSDSQPYTQEKQIFATVTSDALNMRDAPSANSVIVMTLRKGNVLTVLEKKEETRWVKVEYDGKTGYVNSDYIVVTTTAEQPAQQVVASFPSIGTWRVTGRDSGGNWTADMVIEETNANSFSGYFVWRGSGNSGGREYFRGSFDPRTRKVSMQGYRLENDRGIGMGRYEATLNRDGNAFEAGMWGGGGTWTARMQN